MEGTFVRLGFRVYRDFSFFSSEVSKLGVRSGFGDGGGGGGGGFETIYTLKP